MQMPKGVEWAAHSLVVLEIVGGEQPLSSNTLARIYDLSPSYLNKHLQKLVSYGLLTSHPGVNGGFTLVRRAESITLADVVAALDGDKPLFRCSEIRCRGIFSPRANEFRASGLCGINAAMLRAESVWRENLRQVTIADLMAGVDAGSKEEIVRFAGVDMTEDGEEI